MTKPGKQLLWNWPRRLRHKTKTRQRRRRRPQFLIPDGYSYQAKVKKHSYTTEPQSDFTALFKIRLNSPCKPCHVISLSLCRTAQVLEENRMLKTSTEVSFEIFDSLHMFLFVFSSFFFLSQSKCPLIDTWPPGFSCNIENQHTLIRRE